MKAIICSILFLGVTNLYWSQENVKPDDKLKGPLNTVNFELDPLAGAASYNRKFSEHLNPGFGLKIGFSYNIAFTQSNIYNLHEFAMLSLYNRFYDSKKIAIDGGVRVGWTGVENNNGFEPWAYGSYIGAYVNPMVGLEKIKFGFVIGAGSLGGDLIVYTSLLTARYVISF